MKVNISFSFLFTLLFVMKSFGQDAAIFPPPQTKRFIEAVRTDANLRIDGQMDEAIWKRAYRISDFVQVEPYQGERATQQTQLSVLYNDKFLFFGIMCGDSLGKKAVRAIDFKRDFDFRQHDLINLSIDGFRDARNAMVFATNPYGVQRDLLAFDDTYYDLDWDGLWKVRTSRTDTGWTAEIAIPWQTLRYSASGDSIQSWGFNMYRNRRLTNEISAFSPFPRAFSATRMDYAGQITMLNPPPPKPNIRVQPFMLFSRDVYHLPGQAEAIEENNFKPGADLKWAINNNAILDLTANTDFAQADVDRQVNNVTRFSVFFPERRQFFLENASLFGFNIRQSGDGSGGSMAIQPFFSRTIGLDDAGKPIPIDAGGRFVYRSTNMNAGVLAMRQRGDLLNPAAHFFVGRFSHNIGNQNRLGGMVTLKSKPNYTNVVSTLDGFFRISETQSVNTFVMHSRGGQVDRSGFAGIAQYYNSTNNYKIWLTQSFVSKDFNPEMGFVARKDIVGTTPGMNWFYRGKLLPFKKYIRAFEPGFLPEFYWQASTGRFIERQLWFFPFWLNFQRGGYVGYSVNPAFQRLTDSFSPLGIAIQAGDYRYFRQSFWFATDPSKIINLSGTLEWGTYFDGMLTSADINLQFAPSPHFSFNGKLNRNKFVDVGDLKGTRTIDLYGLEGRFAFNPRLQLIAFYQRNTEGDADNYNVRLAWEYQPLSFVYLVFNKNGFTQLDGTRQQEEHFIGKLSFLKQI